MTWRLRALMVLVAGLGGCSHGPPFQLAPGAEKHLREGYRRQLAGAAVVLPVLECNSSRPDLIQNKEARQLTAMFFPRAIWHHFRLPGEPEDGRLPESRELCADLVDNRAGGINMKMASPTMREELRNVFNKNPDKRWLVVVARGLQIAEDRVPPKNETGRYVTDPNALAGHLAETSTIAVSTYVFAESGEVVFRGDLTCEPRGPDAEHDCGRDYGDAAARVSEMLVGFPAAILDSARIVKLPPPEDGPPGAAHPARK